MRLLADANEPEARLLTVDMIPSNGDLATFIIYETCWKWRLLREIILEMREMIAAYMLTLDFYRLRFVSRSMGELFFSKKGFWKARFEIESEREFMAVPKIILHAKKGSRRDWRFIYHLTNVHRIQLD